MRKQELIHLHGLLVQVEHHYEQETGEEVSSEEYESLGVRPTSIHRSKTEHRQAVFALAKALTESMEQELVADGGGPEYAAGDVRHAADTAYRAADALAPAYTRRALSRGSDRAGRLERELDGWPDHTGMADADIPLGRAFANAEVRTRSTYRQDGE